MGRVNKPNVPFVQASSRGGRNRPSLLILKPTNTTSNAGSALAIANAFHQGYAEESYHYIVDELFTYCMVDAKMVAHSGDLSKGSVSILLCDSSSEGADRWKNRSHQLLLNRLADLVAQISLAYGINPRYLSESKLIKWRKWRLKRRGGFVIQGNLARDFWPSEYFLTLVKANIEKYRLINE